MYKLTAKEQAYVDTIEAEINQLEGVLVPVFLGAIENMPEGERPVVEVEVNPAVKDQPVMRFYSYGKAQVRERVLPRLRPEMVEMYNKLSKLWDDLHNAYCYCDEAMREEINRDESKPRWTSSHTYSGMSDLDDLPL